MQTEISFLLELVLNHKLPAGAKQACLERIKSVEEALAARAPIAPQRANAAVMQTPSTQRLLEGAPSPDNVAVVAPAAPVIPPRVVGGEVSTGAGTRGPRKF